MLFWMTLAFAGKGWGALAVGPPGYQGWAINQPNVEVARSEALRSCNHAQCTVELQMEGAYCGAIATGAGGLVAWSYGPEDQQTKDWALQRCQKKDRGCKVQVSACNERPSDWGDRWRAASPPYQPQPRPHPRPVPEQPGGVIPPPMQSPAVIQACEAAFDGDANEERCMQAIKPARFDPVGLIRACEQAFDGDQMELRCVSVASGAFVPISSGLNACEAAFDGDATEMACLEVIVRSAADATPYINQCEQSKNGDAAELACVRTSLGL